MEQVYFILLPPFRE